MPRDTIRVEPISTYLERWQAPVAPVVRAGDVVYVSGLPPFDPATGEIRRVPLERQVERVLEQMTACLAAAGAGLDDVVKCTVYCTSVEQFGAVNAVYARHFADRRPARIFVCVPAWPGPFDVEIDCVAVVQSPAPGTGERYRARDELSPRA